MGHRVDSHVRALRIDGDAEFRGNRGKRLTTYSVSGWSDSNVTDVESADRDCSDSWAAGWPALPTTQQATGQVGMEGKQMISALTAITNYTIQYVIRQISWQQTKKNIGCVLTSLTWPRSTEYGSQPAVEKCMCLCCVHYVQQELSVFFVWIISVSTGRHGNR